MKPDGYKLTNKRYTIPFVPIASLFFLQGFIRTILDVFNRHFQNVLNIFITQLAWIQITIYLGYSLMTIPAGIFTNHNGYGWGIVSGLLLSDIGALLFIPGTQIGEFYVYLVALFVIGCGLMFLETAANPYVTKLGPSETSTNRFNLPQSFNDLRGLFTTLVVGQFLFNGPETDGNMTAPYIILDVLVLAITVAFMRVDLSEIQYQQAVGNQAQGNSYSKLWRHRPFVFGLFVLLAYEVVEISINSYFISSMTGQGWVTDNLAPVVLAAASAFFMVERFLGGWTMRCILPQKTLLYRAVGCVCSVGSTLMDIGKVSMIALTANYPFKAIMFLTVFTLSLSHLRSLTESVSSLLVVTPIGGYGLLLMGYVADTTNTATPFFIPRVSYMVALLFAWHVCGENLSTTTGQ